MDLKALQANEMKMKRIKDGKGIFKYGNIFPRLNQKI